MRSSRGLPCKGLRICKLSSEILHGRPPTNSPPPLPVWGPCPRVRARCRSPWVNACPPAAWAICASRRSAARRWGGTFFPAPARGIGRRRVSPPAVSVAGQNQTGRSNSRRSGEWSSSDNLMVRAQDPSIANKKPPGRLNQVAGSWLPAVPSREPLLQVPACSDQKLPIPLFDTFFR